MAAGEDDHKDLREVRAVLQGLQRIGSHLPPPEDAGENPDGTATTVAPLANRQAVSPLADRPPVQGKRLAALALAMLAGGTVIVLTGDLFLKYWPSAPSGTPAAGGVPSAAVTTERAGGKTSTPPEEASPRIPQAGAVAAVPANPDIASAHQLMDGGHIAAAREMLVRPDLAASQEGAWLLARSYDPNYLATLQSPDASADKRQAEEWYRRWRDTAVSNGMVMDDLRLKRIINSMR
jgi:hypothetical protein